MKSVSNCIPIQRRIGIVKFVAPTFGKNYVVSDGGSGHRFALTLEVVGGQGVGVIQFVSQFPSTTYGRFTYQGQSEIVRCPRLQDMQ